MGLAHPWIPKLETYFVGKLPQLIWQKKIDIEYFMDSSTMSCSKVQLKEMLNLDPNEWKII
jgi:hypothetical protein